MTASLQRPVRLAVFDLDHTLIATDCSEQWALEMQRRGWIGSPDFWSQHRQMMQEYDQGVLCMESYLRLNLSPLVGLEYSHVEAVAEQFVAEQLTQLVYPSAHTLLSEHRARGDHLLMISASEEFLVKPMARYLGFDGAIGIRIAREEGRVTGEPLFPLSYREGKIDCLQSYLVDTGLQPGHTCFYSDSHNDLPLLEWVDQPCPINANYLLRQEAARRQWQLLNL
ncbi:MAG: HAD family phosphatase [Marinobacter sp.]|nr:HAD family phosphatase [Marinobacter sp.]